MADGIIRLEDLPSPPSGKTGWPWTEASPAPPPWMPSGEDWPLISVVTPSYNQAHYLEEAIRSILLQGYPKLEYIIQDGGSTDGSVVIIRRYAPFLTSWTSAPDNGQSNAINKGFSQSNGEILGWINSDDALLPGALVAVATSLEENPSAVLTHGNCIFVDPDGRYLKLSESEKNPSPSLNQLLLNDLIWQPTAWFRQSAMIIAGKLDEDLYYGMDYEYWLRLRKVGPFCFIGEKPIAIFRMQPNAKTYGLPYQMIGEIYRIVNKFNSNGVYSAIEPLKMRLHALIKQDQGTWPKNLVCEINQAEFQSLPDDLRRAARNIIAEVASAMGYRLAKSGHLRQARACFFLAIRHQPSLILNRGILAVIVRATI